MTTPSKGPVADPKASGLEIRGDLLTRNTLWNLLGQGLPLLVAVVTVPPVLRGLGIERFGILTLVWVILNNLYILELGVNRALIKFAAEALGRGDHEKLPALVWTAVVVQGALGILGGLVLVAGTPLLVEALLHMPQDLVGEAKATLYLLAASVPAMLVSASFRGLLEASQRFGLVNAISIASATALYLLSGVGVLLGFQLPGLLVLFLATKVFVLLLLFGVSARVLPILTRSFSFRSSLLLPLLNFGGWITVSNVTGPITRYLDRFVIASLHTVGVVTYYTIPYDVVERFWIIPSSIVMTLFPAFSALAATQRRSLEGIYVRTLKYLLVGAGPILLLTAMYADDLLGAWLGNEFALQSTPVFRILVLAAVVGLLAPVPGSLLQGIGRPDIIAQLYILLLLPNAVLVWFFVRNMGVVGAALSFACRSVVESGLLFYFAWRVAGCSLPLASDKGLRNSIVVLLGFGSFLWCITLLGDSPWLRGGLTLVAISLWAAVTWCWILDTVERQAIATGLRRLARVDAR
jgi:O-antigen/teichoic acid export membrane protein